MRRNSSRPRLRCALLAAGVLPVIAASALADPRADYLLHCAGCHLADARGSPGLVPPLADALGRIASSPEGRDYLARVPGAAQAPISDQAQAEVLNWVLLEFNRESLAPGFKPLSGSEVARSRARVLADPLKLRRELWPDSTEY
jgi:mono/diheme cytochrome c family protein